MKTDRERIQELKSNGYKITFESVFNLAFENYKKIAIYAGLLFLVSITFLGIISLLIIAFTFGLDNLQELLKPENLDPKKFSDEFLMTYIASVTFFSCIASPFLAGIIKMARCADIDEEFHVSTAFEYYKFNYFKELFTATLSLALLNIGISSVLDATGIPILGFIGSIAITILSMLTVPLIIFSNFKAFEAINTSFNLVSKQPLVFLGLLIVVYLFLLTGFFMFFIGLFFTLPFLYSCYYAIYKSVIGFE
ncbi:hypothetical protein [Flavobacterium flavipallidum]|uniref:Membrane protein YesL n=1 Tax=Flavobacterium flavipallidum TaxID=3139140 RepID=A0ABU9HMU9_9FLAO